MKPSIKARLGQSLSVALIACGTLGVTAPKAAAQSDPLLGQMILFAGNFCPRGWADANGQLLAIASNSALFSILGTIYGGDGRTTFGLPDMRGRLAMNAGAGPGLPTYRMGERGGAPSTTLTISQMPAHNHAVNATNAEGNKLGPGDDYLADPRPLPDGELSIYHNGPPNRVMNDGMIGHTGGGQPLTTQSPYLAMTYCIATEGLFPSRN